MSNQLSDLFMHKDLDIQQKIVEELLNEQNLDRKTELQKPLRWSIITTIEQFLTEKKMKVSANILNNFTNLSFRYLISNERKGRLEYIDALHNLTNQLTNQPTPLQNPNDLMKRTN